MAKPPNNARSRRQMLKSVTLLGSASAVIGSSALAALQPTPSQTEGPFYPDIDNDLTFVRANFEEPKLPANARIGELRVVLTDVRG